MTSIEWTDRTWNPIVGCSIVSPGCTNCYAMKMAARQEAMRFGTGHYVGTTKKVNGNAVWTGKLALAPETTLLEPLRRKKPTMYFVNSMGDLFHEDCPDEWIDRVFAVMALCPQHTFQVLTKRAERMQRYFGYDRRAEFINGQIWSVLGTRRGSTIKHDGNWRCSLPLPNVWLGVSTEDQKRADERIPLLLQTPAAVRFISAEPLLGPIDLTNLAREPSAEDRAMPGFDRCTRFYFDALSGREGVDFHGGGKEYHAERDAPHIDWVIVGGESGPGARPMQVEWADTIVEQCREAGVACFVKQLGACPTSDGYPLHLHDRKGGEIGEWPGRLAVRQFPEVRA